MQITVELPDDLAEHDQPARKAIEALAIAGYRSGALFTYETRRLLGLETRYELDGFLKQHGVLEWAYDIEDFKQDMSVRPTCVIANANPILSKSLLTLGRSLI